MTGGFFGVGDKVGHSYHSEREKMSKQSNIWHVLPERDDQVSKKTDLFAFKKKMCSGNSVSETVL